MEKLRTGETVEPEHFYGVSIYFSLILGFVEFVASHTPLQVITFLNHLFTEFDDALSVYDVYKVEVLGAPGSHVSGRISVYVAHFCRLYPTAIW